MNSCALEGCSVGSDVGRKDVDRVKHLCRVQLVSSVINIHLSLGISCEHCVQIVVLTICECDEVLREMPKTLRETGIDREVEAL